MFIGISTNHDCGGKSGHNSIKLAWEVEHVARPYWMRFLSYGLVFISSFKRSGHRRCDFAGENERYW